MTLASPIQRSETASPRGVGSASSRCALKNCIRFSLCLLGLAPLFSAQANEGQEPQSVESLPAAEYLAQGHTHQELIGKLYNHLKQVDNEVFNLHKGLPFELKKLLNILYEMPVDFKKYKFSDYDCFLMSMYERLYKNLTEQKLSEIPANELVGLPPEFAFLVPKNVLDSQMRTIEYGQTCRQPGNPELVRVAKYADPKSLKKDIPGIIANAKDHIIKENNYLTAHEIAKKDPALWPKLSSAWFNPAERRRTTLRTTGAITLAAGIASGIAGSIVVGAYLGRRSFTVNETSCSSQGIPMDPCYFNPSTVALGFSIAGIVHGAAAVTSGLVMYEVGSYARQDSASRLYP